MISTTAKKCNIFFYLCLIVGTFGASELLSEESDCTQCTGGYYCESPGEGLQYCVSIEAKKCDKCFYLCLIVGTFGASEFLSEESDCTQCTGGYYCESPGEGLQYRVSIEAKKCDKCFYLCLIVGTFGASEFLSEESDCTQCTGGYYCESPGGGLQYHVSEAKKKCDICFLLVFVCRYIWSQ